MRNVSPHQADLFQQPVFESRAAVPDADLDIDRYRLRMKGAMAKALKPHDRGAIARTMGRMLGGGAMSKAMLDAYTSPAKDHDISLVRFKCLVRATGATALWDIAVSDDGLMVLAGDEPRLAEIARLQQEQRAIGEQLRKLRSVPVQLTREAR